MASRAHWSYEQKVAFEAVKNEWRREGAWADDCFDAGDLIGAARHWRTCAALLLVLDAAPRALDALANANDCERLAVQRGLTMALDGLR